MRRPGRIRWGNLQPAWLNRQIVLIGALYFLTAVSLLAQELPDDAHGDTESKPSTLVVQPGFREIVVANGALNLVVWVLIAAASFTTITISITAYTTTKHDRLLPDRVVVGVKSFLESGDLSSAIGVCEQSPGPLSSILMAGFTNIYNGWEAINAAVEAAVEIASERIHQRVGYLNLCGQIAPMLGLLGTVIGMVNAFSGLAGEAGAAKTQLLALAISGALWTTVAGLLVSVPALLAYTVLRNRATQHTLEIQATVIDLLKTLRDAKVEA